MRFLILALLLALLAGCASTRTTVEYTHKDHTISVTFQEGNG